MDQNGLKGKNLIKISCVRGPVSDVRCHFLPVTLTCDLLLFACLLSPATCPLSLTQKATTTDPPPVKSPNIYTVGWVPNTQTPQNVKIIVTLKPENVYRYTNISNTLFDQKSPVHREVEFPDMDRLHTDNAT